MATTNPRLFISVSLCALLAGSIANATVTQVDGTIIPEGPNLQPFLPAGVNAVQDAAELPEVFLPNTIQPVVFTNLAEGASFENVFGWYNVGDDITTDTGRRTNLHPILGCGVQMQNHAYDPGQPAMHADHHHGDPNAYIQNSEPIAGLNTISVDFAAEQAAGRYNGGFIAFYLITQEDPANPAFPLPNTFCGDYVQVNNLSGFGYIYHTEKDRNNDGDFVHHLVYSDPGNADRFLFGFEDLFRGGDNDFEDMLISVDGLTPPCIPTAEVCDGIDNDCDGLIDADDPDMTEGGDPCVCDNNGIPCADGVVFGECQTGQTVCIAGEIQCQSITPPSPEICDNLDNNCNGTIDDNPSGTGAPCDGTDADLCPEGVEICQNGQIVCDDNTGPNAELCNNLDDDCDTVIDETLIDEGATCGSDIGECQAGAEVCVNGTLECQGEVGPSPEICDGLDNDCNVIPDDNPTDVNQPCGSNVGECTPGVTICVNGAPTCAGETGPLPEACDNLDNDCDGPIDENAVGMNIPCNAPAGFCGTGVLVCNMGMIECQGGTPGTPEVCDGLDNDCNDIIDDNPTDVGGMCGTMEGMCEQGTEQCVNGQLECVGGTSMGGTETCNGMDDDCDGNVDEGVLCEGGACQDGVCSAPCLDGEFPCPVGQLCNEADFCVDNPCFGVDCPPGDNGERMECDNGACVLACSLVECNGDRVCRDSDAACVPNNCNFLPLCEDDEVCVEGVCSTDPCADISCPDGQFCRGGDCIASCADVVCEGTEECRDGACVPTGCERECLDSQVCSDGRCINDPCDAIICDLGQACDPQTTECVTDPCTGVECPAGQSCDFGDCFATTQVDPERVTAAGGGCAVGGGGDLGFGWLLLALGAVMLGVSRGRYSRVLIRLGVCALALGALLSLTSCSVNPFCINCEQGVGDIDAGAGDGDGGVTDGDGGVDPMMDAGGTDGGVTGNCEDGVALPEECDGEDNDCDGETDEDFDLAEDPFNCGACGEACILDGAATQCSAATCSFVECFPGRVDLDGDTAGPYDQSNGCEYLCFESNGGAEACDALDNDCDGDSDEGFDLLTDVNNCGQCNLICNIFQATPSCVAGMCTFDPATDCNGGFHDNNGDPTDGCEYACMSSGAEVCDLADNDCDGDIDEGIDTMTDVTHCGACLNPCDPPNATPMCVGGMCTFDPVNGCDPGFHDINGNPLDGCEYACVPTGVEVCDLLDNDCNGVVNDNPVDVGQSCNAAPSGTPTGICTDAGTVVCAFVGGTPQPTCVGAPEPQPETCDNVDEDCDGTPDNGVSRACYTGPMGTEGVGVCTGGVEVCVGGMFPGPCVGEVVPNPSETCDGFDDDCDASIDEGMGGGPLTEVCYTGTPGTDGIGVCTSGLQTCNFGAPGPCVGEVVDQAFDVCGDGLDTDCDGNDDAAEGCMTLAVAEVRLDDSGSGGPLGTNPGEEHSFDLQVGAGGNPVGTRLYAVWSDLSNGNADIFLRRSVDGGVTWLNIQNLTPFVPNAAVKPVLVVVPGTTNDTVFVVLQQVQAQDRDIMVARSINSGVSWSDPGGAVLGTADDSFHQHAAASADGTTLSVVWESLDTTTLDRTIRNAVSTNSGSTFGAERVINVGSGGSPIAGRPQAAVTSTGRFVFAWREIRAGSTNDVFTAFSDSPTAAINPANEVRVDGDGGDNRNSDLPVLQAVGQNVYLTWQDISNLPGGGSDVVFVRSTNNGGGYSGEEIIDDPASEVSSSFTPVMTVDPRTAGSTDDRVFLAWEDRRQGTQIFTAVSTNSGATFANAVRATSNNGDPITGVTRAPAIAYAGGDSLVVAYTNDVGTGVEGVFVTSSIDAGQTWQFTHSRADLGTGRALNPVAVPVSGGGFTSGAAAGWLDFRTAPGINGDPFIRRIGQ